jgi:hypothetical protein
MMQSHSERFDRTRHISPIRSQLLRQHPVLTPIALLCGSIIVGIASLFSDGPSPILALIGISAAPLYLSIACVLGLAGILVSIISLIEQIERRSVPAALYSGPKEQSYGNRN